MSIAILKCGIDEPFHRARFNFYISLLSEEESDNRLNLGISWLKDAEKVATARQKKSIHQFKQTMMSVKRKLVDMGTPDPYPQPHPSHTHSHTHDHDSAPSARSPNFGLDGTNELSPADLDGPSEIPTTDMGRDGTGQPHPDLSFTSTSESNEEHEPSAAEAAAKERLAGEIAALKRGGLSRRTCMVVWASFRRARDVKKMVEGVEEAAGASMMPMASGEVKKQRTIQVS
ncbi:hypothetical protein LTR97_002046 [Elasticomyces elasticus]|uniref:Uncharacterized protein n=1 Tax=Elasticomyces elasticus TaxID=574655 RepID=A0AAN8A529_9PEZI|nr:hypothetical protein LTR97_002046 [Elasticomyces elasticus]